MATMTFYCVKCHAKKDVDEKDWTRTTMKNGRPAAKAKCPDCGTGMYRILPKDT